MAGQIDDVPNHLIQLILKYITHLSGGEMRLPAVA